MVMEQERAAFTSSMFFNMAANFIRLPLGEVLQGFPHGSGFHREDGYGKATGAAACRAGDLLSQGCGNGTAEDVNFGYELPVVVEKV
jgi:hypothetical protein